jgi:hypothetical protein
VRGAYPARLSVGLLSAGRSGDRSYTALCLPLMLAAGTRLNTGALRAKPSSGSGHGQINVSRGVSHRREYRACGSGPRDRRQWKRRPNTVRQCAGAASNSDHLASTGKTLPHPGVPRASGTTDLDRSIQKQDERIQDSICKGCRRSFATSADKRRAGKVGVVAWGGGARNVRDRLGFRGCRPHRLDHVNDRRANPRVGDP